MKKQNLYILPLLLFINFPFMSYATCESAHINNKTQESLLISFENKKNHFYAGGQVIGYGNVWFQNNKFQNCNAKNGPCTLSPGESAEIDYTTTGAKASGLVTLTSYNQESKETGNIEFSYTNADGNYSYAHCPSFSLWEDKESYAFKYKTNTAGDIDLSN